MISHDEADANKGLNNLYSQFKNDKLKQYKNRFSSMSIKQMTNKIVKEWNAHTLEQQRQQKIGNNDELNLNLEVKSNLTPNKLSKPNQIGSTNSKKKSAKTPQQQIQINTPIEFEEKAGQSIKKTKLITKNTKGDYIQFYKRHYFNYTKQHPRWTSQQKSIIIKLLWKKQVNKPNKINFQTHNQHKKNTNMSAKMAFKKSGINNTDKAWKKLPLQSKRLWKNKCESIADEQMIDDQIVRLPKKKVGLQFMNQK